MTLFRISLLLWYAVFAFCTTVYGQCDPEGYLLVGSSGTTSNAFTAAGGTTAVTLLVPNGCSWTITGIPSWVTILNGTSGTNSRDVQMSIAANSAVEARSAVLLIGTKRFPIFQTGVSLMFTQIQPCRIADTRGVANYGAAFGPPHLAAGAERSFNILSSVCPVPVSAKAYALNITLVPKNGPVLYLTVWPTGRARPNASTLNSFDGRIVANAAIIAAGVNGAISTYASNDTDVIIDINGYFSEPPGGLAFYPVTPCRVMDTRPGQGFTGTYGSPAVAANSVRTISITQGNCGIPTTAQAYSLNFTVVPHGPLNYLVAYPAGQPQPPSSTLNSLNGSIVANAAIVPTGPDGMINIFVTNDTDVIADINGYFAPAGSPNALGFHPVTPCRISDTRGVDGFTGSFGAPSVQPGSPRTIPVRSSGCGIPSLATTYVLNATAVPPGPLIYLTVQPTGPNFLGVSTLNAPTGQVTANMAIVPAGTNGSVDLYSSQVTDVILDLNGYFTF